MMKIKTIQDVVDWGLCVGCGACYAFCEKEAVRLENFEGVGIRPVFDVAACSGCTDCLAFCPGVAVDATVSPARHQPVVDRHLISDYLEIWDGYASDQEVRFHASSGGILTALAQYCLEHEGMNFVLHTGMNTVDPWKNRSVQSYTRNDLIQHAGSRYCTSSPCDCLRMIEESDRPCVFIGKPCDVAAVSVLRKIRPGLDKKLGLVMTFFCAGTPSAAAGRELLNCKNMDSNAVSEIRYRGRGWPGGFTALDCHGNVELFMPYLESWDFLQKFRPFRCQLCPDGLGALADISCGDAWHQYCDDEQDIGRSLVVVRSEKGRAIVSNAMQRNYVSLQSATSQDVIRAQGLIDKRKQIFGRLFALRCFGIPVPRFLGYHLYASWRELPILVKVKSILGTVRRVFRKKLWIPKFLGR